MRFGDQPMHYAQSLSCCMADVGKWDMRVREKR
jgi:hypothetical protein